MMTINPPPAMYTLVLSLVAGVPLLFAVGCCIPSWSKQVERFLPWSVLPALLTALAVPAEIIVEVPWFFMGGRMGLDETGRIFLGFTTFIWFLAAFSIRRGYEKGVNRARLYSFFLTAMAGNFGIILAQDILGFYLFFALMSFTGYGLIVFNGTIKALNAGRIYLILVMIGEVALFTAMIIIVNHTGSLAITDITSTGCLPELLVLLFIGFGIKAGAMPLHGWMVPSYQAAPASAAAALAGAMVNAGVLGWLRFLPPDKTTCPRGAFLFLSAGFLASIYGVLTGLRQRNPGAILAGSSISQMGLITVLFGLSLLDTTNGVHAQSVLILYVVHHALAKSSLFFGVDLLRHRQGKASPFLIIGMLLPALSLAGLPLTSGAIGKTAFKDLASTLGEPWLNMSYYFLPLTALATSLLMFHFIQVLRTQEKNNPSEASISSRIWVLSLIGVALPLWILPAADQYAALSLEANTIRQSIWPVAGGLLFFFCWCKIKNKYLFPINRHHLIKPEFLIRLHTKVLRPPMLLEQWKTKKEKGIIKFETVFPLALRKYERILGRWSIASLLYIMLCLLLFFFSSVLN